MNTRTEKLTPRHFSKKEIGDIHYMMQRTWDTIGMDILQCTADSEGTNREQIGMKRSHVVEVVLDASYIEAYGPSKPEDEKLLEKFRKLDYKNQIKIARQHFIYKTYGM